MSEFFEQLYQNKTLQQDDLRVGEYEVCEFINCNASGLSLRDYKFIDCTFVDCDFSNANLLHVAFQNCSFVNCKLLGLHWEDANDFLFEVRFENCNLTHSSFYGMSISKTQFVASKCIGVDFTNADLSSANFENSDLLDCKFDHTNLEKANFLGALNLVLDPAQNKMKHVILATDQLPGLLTQYNLKIK